MILKELKTTLCADEVNYSCEIAYDGTTRAELGSILRSLGYRIADLPARSTTLARRGRVFINIAEDGRLTLTRLTDRDECLAILEEIRGTFLTVSEPSP